MLSGLRNYTLEQFLEGVFKLEVVSTHKGRLSG